MGAQWHYWREQRGKVGPDGAARYYPICVVPEVRRVRFFYSLFSFTVSLSRTACAHQRLVRAWRKATAWWR